MSYSPKKFDVPELPAEMSPLIEQIAAGLHDDWAAQRIADGWVYGPKRDDEARHHPCIVPYDELPESEKEYDRNMAVGTIGRVLAAGWTVSRG